MEFYTSVYRRGDKILYRGYRNGEPQMSSDSFNPTLFVRSPKPTGWKSTLGFPLKPILFDSMSAANGFMKGREGIDNTEVHGMNNFAVQYVNEKFPGGFNPDTALVNITTIDIEVASDEGFPQPEDAAYPVLSIAIKSNKSNVYHVWGFGEYDASLSLIGEDKIRYVHCDNELDLLLKFTTFWAQLRPEVVTGWSSKYFDIPYLVNRIQRVLPGDTVKKLAPWGTIKDRIIHMNNRQVQVFDLVGLEQLDYLDLFQKFGVYSYGVQESYKLDHIASVVLGENKLSYEEQGNLHSLYKNDYQKFIDYNVKDVELVVRLEEQMGLIELAMTIAYKAGTNYSDALGTTGLWDAYLYRMLTQQSMVPPPKKVAEKEGLLGGYVKAPQVGKHDWVVSFDLASLYPHIMMQYNLSPETIVPERTEAINVDVCLDRQFTKTARPDCCMTANGTHYRKDVRGIIPKAVDGLYAERSEAKSKMAEKNLLMEKIEEEIRRRNI